MIEECKCRYCKERYVGCHSTCENYLQWRKEKDEQNKSLANEKFLKELAWSEKLQANIKSKKRRRM